MPVGDWGIPPIGRLGNRCEAEGYAQSAIVRWEDHQWRSTHTGASSGRSSRAQAANDLATLVEILAEDIVWHLPCGGTRLSLDPTVVGLGALAEMSARNFEASNGTFRFELEHVFAGYSYAAAMTRNTATTAYRTLDLHMVIQFQFEDGKIVEVWESPDDIDAFTDFWQVDGV